MQYFFLPKEKIDGNSEAVRYVSPHAERTGPRRYMALSVFGLPATTLSSQWTGGATRRYSLVGKSARRKSRGAGSNPAIVTCFVHHRDSKEVIPITAESSYPTETTEVDKKLERDGKIAKSDYHLQKLRKAASSMSDVMSWLKARRIEPGNETRTF